MATLFPTQPNDTQKGRDSSLTSDSDSEIQNVIPEYGSYPNHVFANPTVGEYWRKKYYDANYEGRHRFDPTFTWTADEEKRVRRKVCFQSWRQIPGPDVDLG
jgi:hypothetical protein